MQHARLNRELSNEAPVRGGTNNGPLLAVRTDLSSLFNDYTSLQRHGMYNDDDVHTSKMIIFLIIFIQKMKDWKLWNVIWLC